MAKFQHIVILRTDYTPQGMLKIYQGLADESWKDIHGSLAIPCQKLDMQHPVYLSVEVPPKEGEPGGLAVTVHIPHVLVGAIVETAGLQSPLGFLGTTQIL